MLKKFIRIVGGDPSKREIDRYAETTEQINALEDEFEELKDEQITARTAEFRRRLENGESLEDILPEAFALVREASKRTIGLRHFDVQMIGGIALHNGRIAEMRTGEGKTLVATLPLYLNALTGKGAHLITVNDYLARRDARWMFPIYQLLGLSVGVLQMAARTENGKKAFVIDPDRHSPYEDQDELRMVPRSEAYAADITYGTNSEFGFDYLRDNMTMSLDERVQRGHHYAIIDEVDNVLIDEARTPLIISGPAQDEAQWYIRMAQVVRALRPEDYEVSEKDRMVTLTEIGEGHVEELLGMELRDPERPEDLTLEQERMLGYLEQALRAQFLFKRNKDYLVQGGKVIIVDEFTGRMMPGRRWSDGLHQAVEAKEGARVQSESVTYATITIQNYFRMYEKLSGMTGTALTEAEEFDKIYKLDVLAIPTNLEYRASVTESDLVEREDRDELGYKYKFYTTLNDPLNLPVYWKRKDYPDVVYRTEESKLRAIAREILLNHALGRPVLLGTTSVEMSERVSSRLRAEPLRRLAQVLLLRNIWMDQNDRIEDGRQVAELEFLNIPLDKLEIAEMRRMARDLNISFNPEDKDNLAYLSTQLGLSEDKQNRLAAALAGGIPHQVLNARKHTEESQIIANAGALGAVTIATNMAGRGVDIKLGGELREEALSAVNRILRRNGYHNPYDMTLDERSQAIQAMDSATYGIYEERIKEFLDYMSQMAQVKTLGGLHVIGSERHEARRIDNQLRGRAARQGDPGSSRFYLSMEDDLMRLFGGGQVDNIMQRIRFDDAVPLEVGLVGRIVEQSQTRVEGHNFDTRKHLLEYDDVLNTQRATIYNQRDRIFKKDDLTEDVTEMLQTELNRRVKEALKDEGGPWKLIAWLDQIQPPQQLGQFILPSYSLKLLLNHLTNQFSVLDNQAIRNVMLKVAEEALQAEKFHHLQSIQSLLTIAEDRLETQISERMESLEMFFDGLDLEEEGASRRPAELASELTSAVGLPLKLPAEIQRALRDDPETAAEQVRPMVEETLINQSIERLTGSVERRLGDALDLDTDQLAGMNWSEINRAILDATEAIYDMRANRLLEADGSITRDLENALARLPDLSVNKINIEQLLLSLLLLLPQGARTTFDKKTHRRKTVRTTRLNYIYYAAQFVQQDDPEDVTEQVLDHFEDAQLRVRQAWGLAEFNRLRGASISELEPGVRESILEALDNPGDGIVEQPLEALHTDQQKIIADELGRRLLTAIYRQILLRVSMELWVEYLTQMEALRVSVGLEAYAQRDPLVQYKNRAFELFRTLLDNMRTGVVNLMFTYQPRDISTVQTELSQEEEEQIETDLLEEQVETQEVLTSQPVQQSDQSKGKRKRKRHR